MVKVINIDPSGKVRLSRKALLEDADEPAGGEGGAPREHAPREHGPREHGGRPGGGRPGGRGGDRGRRH
jgi:hypothetical protein